MSGREVLDEYNEMLDEAAYELDFEKQKLHYAREAHRELCVPGFDPEAVKAAWDEVLEHSRLYNYLLHRCNQLNGRIRIWVIRLKLA